MAKMEPGLCKIVIQSSRDSNGKKTENGMEAKVMQGVWEGGMG